MRLLTTIFVFYFLLFQTAMKPNPLPKAKHQFIVICHRGDHTIYPENTLNGYKQAIVDGADYIEIDLRTTSDGKLVSMHDASVDRMTDGKGLVKDFTLAQIEALKVKSKRPQDTAVYRVPTFLEILKLCKNKIHIYIDFKEAPAQQTLDELRQFRMEKQVLVYINKASQITDWRKTMPEMPLMLSLPGQLKDTAVMAKFINQYRPDVLDGNYTDYNPDLLNYARRGGLTVWPDAQSPLEGPAVWDKVIAMGFKGVQTDNPPALINYLKEKGLR